MWSETFMDVIHSARLTNKVRSCANVAEWFDFTLRRRKVSAFSGAVRRSCKLSAYSVSSS